MMQLAKCSRKLGQIHSSKTNRLIDLTSYRDSTTKTSHQFQNSAASSDATSNVKEIVIPLRKKRDEFSILKALSSTMKDDFSAPHFKFIDDPFLIPMSSLDKRTFALAKASGRKAANYVVNEYPNYFAHNPAEPSIESFVPISGFAFEDNTLEGLHERIERRNPIAAFGSYQKILDGGLDVPQETAEDLLDLLCYYNSEDPPERLLADELFFHRDVGQDSSKKMRKEWKDDGAAETLFKLMKEPSVKASCSIIRGRAKYYQIDRALDEFYRLKSSGAKVDIATYNAVLAVSPLMKEHVEARWQIVQEFLRDIALDGLSPDIDTFNAVCFTLSRCSRFRETRAWFMQTLSEMKNCNIEPSLTTWFYGLQIFYGADNAQSRFLYDVVDYLQDKPLLLRETTDYEFFSSAMIKCFVNLKDLELAYKIDHLLTTNNSALLGDSFREGLYYTHFLRLLCLYEQIDKVMEAYNNFTPHRYTPTFTAMEELLNAIDLNDGFEHLPRIWSDMILFQYTRRMDLVEHLLSIMAKKRQESQLQQLFLKTVKDIQKQAQIDAMNRRLSGHQILSGKMIGSMTLIFLNAEDFKGAWDAMEFFIHNKHHLQGFPSEQSLVRLAEGSIEKSDVEKTLQILSLMSDFGYPKLDELVEKVKLKLNLTDHQKSHLEDLL